MRTQHKQKSMADAQARERDRIRAAAAKTAEEEKHQAELADRWIRELLRPARVEAGK